MPEGSPKRTEVEDRIIKARLKGPSFCQICDAELKWITDQIMFRTAALVGCGLPQTEEFADIISTELIVLINDFGYSEITFEEILLALRLNAKGGLKYPSGLDIERVGFSGTVFNVDFISRILSNYMAIRNSLDSKLRNHIDGY